ncbi:MAG: ABC transporter substrate-binding protein [Oscillatoriaceae cyanobacterium Prado104]|jgi:ABC-type branched-subunit amino acid transport system substrate-binding protein/tRNA A-37 threonylcarbamoyl transferase component Bud32|nr:ABC transporter substrate-binding protein [Oscillatoriaceae cyanobacterium Prado104]
MENLSVNTKTRTVKLGSESVDLNKEEYVVLLLLSKHYGKYVEPVAIFNAMYKRQPEGGEYKIVVDRIIELRKKLKDTDTESKLIHAEPSGSGKYGILALESKVEINGEILLAAEQQPSVDRLLNNRYRVIKKLGEGGFGLTLLAEDLQMPSHRSCVIKQLKPNTKNPKIDQSVRERFAQEAAVLEKLGEGHSQIPELYGHFEEDGLFFLAQEWIDGETLSDRVKSNGKMTEQEVKEILLSLLSVLDYIHEKQIIHRDIKPQNIIFRNSDSQPVLIDFGVVKETFDREVNTLGSDVTASMGTPQFMAPEQAAGRPEYSSDLYSLGLTAIYLLTGVWPHELATDAETREIVWRDRAGKIGVRFGAILDKSIRFHPRTRFATAKEMLAALQEPITPVVHTSEVPEPVSKSSKKIWFVGILALALLALGASVFYFKKEVKTALKYAINLAESYLYSDVASEPTLTPTTSPENIDVSNYISAGDRLLFPATSTNPDKQAGIAAFAAGDWQTAASKLEAAFKVDRTDPETLIYLNNARLNSAETIKIAAVVPISNSPSTATEILRGIAQAQDEAIKAGVPLKVIIADDGNDEIRAKAIAQNFVKNSTILAVIGHGISKTSLAVAPIYNQHQIVAIAPTSTSTELAKVPKREDGINYIFRTAPSDQISGTALARYILNDLKKSTVAIFYNSQSSYSKSLQVTFSTTLVLEGGQVVAEVDLSQPNAAARMAEISADVLVLLPDSDTLKSALEIAKINQNRLPVIGGDALYNTDLLKEGGSILNGAIISVPWHFAASKNPNFVTSARSLWGIDVNWRAAMSYDAVQVLRMGRSIGQITPKSGQQGRVILAETLTNSNFKVSGASGEIRFLSTGDRNSNVVLLQVAPNPQSVAGYDFVPLPNFRDSKTPSL